MANFPFREHFLYAKCFLIWLDSGALVLGFRLSQGKRNFSTKLLCWKCHESLLWGMFWGVRGRLGSGALWVKIFVFSRSHPIFFLPVLQLQTESMPIVSLYILIFNSQASGIIQYVWEGGRNWNLAESGCAKLDFSLAERSSWRKEWLLIEAA